MPFFSVIIMEQLLQSKGTLQFVPFKLQPGALLMLGAVPQGSRQPWVVWLLSAPQHVEPVPLHFHHCLLHFRLHAPWAARERAHGKICVWSKGDSPHTNQDSLSIWRLRDVWGKEFCIKRYKAWTWIDTTWCACCFAAFMRLDGVQATYNSPSFVYYGHPALGVKSCGLN